ncbi:hypothetical protein [Citricoccus sp.]|uniref:hypothetical protein n=1 Tax=Citricoccus sp. TaxID=1978372 RepID=UPI00263806A2|nr:hypothetical protein [Citricoccus sp.]HRO31541.1 hypothetical protein [Citricoccus sp.]HRO95020.1 hypothetical protein [Citricoccus sp.]
MPGFRRKSLAHVRTLREDLAAARLADAQPPAPAEQHRGAPDGLHRSALERTLFEDRGGVHVLVAAGIARAATAQHLAGTESAESESAQAEADEVRAAEQALMLAVQARRRAERVRDHRDRQQRALTGRADQQELDALASTAHRPSGDHR